MKQIFFRRRSSCKHFSLERASTYSMIAVTTGKSGRMSSWKLVNGNTKRNSSRVPNCPSRPGRKGDNSSPLGFIGNVPSIGGVAGGILATLFLSLGNPSQETIVGPNHGSPSESQQSRSTEGTNLPPNSRQIQNVPEDSDLYRMLHTQADTRRGRADAGPRDHSRY
jgi:hypothetical protein